MKLSSAWLINIVMDGPSVNQSFLRQLQSNLQGKAHKSIDIDSCPLHIVNNVFKKALVELQSIIELDQISADLHFFFKRSAARLEDYILIKQITEVTVWYMKEHVESRWLSIDRSLIRILEQLRNLRVYILEKLSKEKGFNGKNDLGNSDRHTRIWSMLKSKEAQICMSFVIFLAQDFSCFIVPLQTSAPMVQRLYSMCHEVIRNVLGKVVKEELLHVNGKPHPMQRWKKLIYWMRKTLR